MPWQRGTFRQRSSVKMEIIPPIKILTDARFHFLVWTAKWPHFDRQSELKWLCKTFRGIIRLWKLNNVVIPQPTVINTETQIISPCEKLSKTSILALVSLLCAWLKGELQMVQVEVFVF